MPKTTWMSDQELRDLYRDKAQNDAGYAIAHAILKLADAQERTANQIKDLGLADAATPMGAIEMLGKTFEDRLGEIAEAIREVKHGDL